ncbi:MAG TPA: flagellar motor protein MotB [Bryobacteraceae bacterium]|jgi:chemotaxis protein MotB|nr:flagellar motor protein MotB [Bryobacteraceae bacterium]
MARKKAHPEHENHERWLISYADFITLLFAFFVVMFASSQVDKKKTQQVSDSVTTALEKGAQASAKQFVPRGIEDPKGKGGSQPASEKAESAQAAAAELLPSMKFLKETLSHEIESGKIEVHMEARGLVVSLHEGAFFKSGDDKIIPESYPSIAKIAAVIRSLHNPVRLEGHTDSIPIHTARFDSNWELAAARAISMLNLLATQFSIPRSRCAIAGYADTIPVDTNLTPEGRARNRRVDVVILNEQALVDARPDPAVTAATAATAAPETKSGTAAAPKKTESVAVPVARPAPAAAPDKSPDKVPAKAPTAPGQPAKPSPLAPARLARK